MSADYAKVIEQLQEQRTAIDAAIESLKALTRRYPHSDGGPPSPARPKAKAKPAKTGAYKCPDCGKRFAKAQGLGPHRAKAHGFRASATPTKRAKIPLTKCPNCDAITTLDPCERCHKKLPTAAIGKK